MISKDIESPVVVVVNEYVAASSLLYFRGGNDE